MKYKIEITTYNTNRQVYRVYVRRRKIIKYWQGIDRDGEEIFASRLSNRVQALEVIDLHFHGNCVISNIAVEYVNKP